MSRATRLHDRMQVTIAAVVIAIAGGLATDAKAEAASPDGIWYTKGQESIIKVHPCGDSGGPLCGTMVWLKEPTETDGSPKLDKLNKDPAKKGKPMIGLDILLNMKPDEDHYKGKAYNPEDGKFYDITFKVKEDDSADLRGCVLGFLCQTETFTRAKEVPGGDPTAGKKKSAKSTKSTAHR